MPVNLSLLQSEVLDMSASGKTPRQIEARLGVPAAEVHRMVNELLDNELEFDVESKRKMQLYRFEKIVEALFERVKQNADRDDVKNLNDTMEKINELMALHRERDTEELKRVTSHQAALYIATLRQLISSFKVLAPNIMTDAEWDTWAGEQLAIAQEMLRNSDGQLSING